MTTLPRRIALRSGHGRKHVVCDVCIVPATSKNAQWRMAGALPSHGRSQRAWKHRDSQAVAWDLSWYFIKPPAASEEAQATAPQRGGSLGRQHVCAWEESNVPSLIKSSELQPGQMKLVDLQGAPVAIANVGGVFYAFSDVCSHAACSLSEGRLDGDVVTCRKDGSQFELSTGRVLQGPAEKRVRTYRIQIAGDDLRI